MGDRTTTYLPCPRCGKESEQYDAPSCILWSWTCSHCGWRDNRDYYETGPHTIELLTVKEAKNKNVLIKCPDCSKYDLAWQIKRGGWCFECGTKEDGILRDKYEKRKFKTKKNRAGSQTKKRFQK